MSRHAPRLPWHLRCVARGLGLWFRLKLAAALFAEAYAWALWRSTARYNRLIHRERYFTASTRAGYSVATAALGMRWHAARRRREQLRNAVLIAREVAL